MKKGVPRNLKGQFARVPTGLAWSRQERDPRVGPGHQVISGGFGGHIDDLGEHPVPPENIPVDDDYIEGEFEELDLASGGLEEFENGSEGDSEA